MGNGGGDGPGGGIGSGADSPVGGGAGSFGGMGFGGIGGVSGPDSGIGGIGPADYPGQVYGQNTNLPRPFMQQGNQSLPTFQIDPNQVANDIALGSGWGLPTTPSQMSPFSMYGNQQSPFNWGNYFQNFGGK